MNNIVILTNLMTPYRKFLYDKLYEEFKKNGYNLNVLIMAETESGRHWNYEEFKTEYSTLLKHKTIRIGGIDIHINKDVKKILKELRPVTVVCGGSYLFPSVWETIHLRSKLKYKLLYWSESHLNEVRNLNSLKIKLREYLRKKIISKFDGFWYVGKFSKEFIMKYANEKAEYIFLPNLINNDRFEKNLNTCDSAEIRNKYGIKQGNKVFITPARLIKVKGLIEFLNLYVKAKHENSTYLIAGDGELKDEIQNLINANNIDIKLIGYKNEKEIIELYSISNGLILPSLSDPNPLSCIEACWCKLPLLVSEHVGNYPEIVKDEINGYVFSYLNEEEAVDKINSFINASSDWEINAKKSSYEIAKNVYSPDIAICNVVNETIRGITKVNVN